MAVQKIVTKRWRTQDLPPAFYLINDGSNELAQQFVDDARVDLISFTGSSAVGRKVGERVAASAWASSCSNSAATTRSSSTSTPT